MTVLIYNENRELQALLYSHACHTTSREFSRFSADFPAAIKKYLQLGRGEDLFVSFFQGAGGDIKPRFISSDGKSFKAPSPEEFDAFGKRHAEDILQFIDSDAMKKLTLNVSCKETSISLPFDPKTFKSSQEILSALEEEMPSYKRLWYQNMLESIRTGSVLTDYALSVACIKITDDLQMVTLSGEIAAELGLMIKSLFKDKQTVVLAYTSDVNIYVPSNKMLPEDGYEAEASMYNMKYQSGKFLPEVDQRISEAVRFLF